jgi:hypothetical protein
MPRAFTGTLSVANTLLTDQHITNEALMILENELTFTKQVDRQYSTEFTKAKRGATVYVRKPPKYVVRDGQTIAVQDTTQSQVPITLNHQFGVDVEFFSSDLALSISDFGADVLQPQIAVIANAIDLAGLAQYVNVFNSVGTPGTTPGTGATAQASLAVYAQAQAYLDKYAAPRDKNRATVINEDAQAITVPNLAGLFNPTDVIGKQYTEGNMGRALGSKFSMDQNVNMLTIGSLAGTPLINGTITPATGPQGTALGTITPFTINTKGWTASTKVLNGGEVFTLPLVFGINPASLQNNGKLAQFGVVGPVTSDASGNATITLNQAIILPPSAYATVTALPVTDAALTFVGAAAVVTPQNMAFHKNAFTLACVDLPLPGGVHMAARKSDKQLGISMRFVASYDVVHDLFIGRFDVLCGWASLRPEWAVRIQG